MPTCNLDYPQKEKKITKLFSTSVFELPSQQELREADPSIAVRVHVAGIWILNYYFCYFVGIRCLCFDLMHFFASSSLSPLKKDMSLSAVITSSWKIYSCFYLMNKTWVTSYVIFFLFCHTLYWFNCVIPCCLSFLKVYSKILLLILSSQCDLSESLNLCKRSHFNSVSFYERTVVGN